MRLKLILLPLIAVAAVALIAFAYFYLFNRGTAPASIQQPPGYTFPVGSTTDTDNVAVGLQGGGTIPVKDFIHNGITVADPANPGDYFLAGGSGACDAAGNCPNAQVSDDFNIVYFSQDNSFIVGLAREPLGQARQEAEQYLMQQLGLGQREMCALNYMVNTTVYVNPVYGSMGNLGFSFCSGAVKLP